MPRYMRVLIGGLVVCAVVVGGVPSGRATVGTPGPEAVFAQAEAAAGERKTYVYRGARRVAEYVWDGPPYGQIWGACLSGNAAWPNAKGTTIVLRNSGEFTWGYARRQSSRVWTVFASNDPLSRVVGSVRRVTAARWNGYDGKRLAGHTRGPDGPAAWAAYLIFCNH